MTFGYRVDCTSAVCEVTLVLMAPPNVNSVRLCWGTNAGAGFSVNRKSSEMISKSAGVSG